MSRAGLFINEYQQTYSEFGIQQSKLWPKGTLLITIAANIAETSILSIEAAFPDSIIGFESEQVNMIFIKKIIDNASNTLKRKAETSSQANLNLTKLSELDIKLPSLIEQIKIGSFLKQLDNLIALHQRKLETLKQLKQAYLQNMFPQKGESVPKLRFANYHGVWEQRKLGEMLKEFSVKSKTEDEYTVLSSTNSGMEIRDGRVSGTSNLGYKIIEDGDLVLSPQNLWLGNINVNDIGKGLVSPSYRTFKFVDLNSQFIEPQLRLPRMLEEYKNASTQGASVVRRNLELESFYQIPIRIPSSKEQNKVGSFFKQLDDTITLHQNKLKKLQSLKKAYLQKMFV